MPISKNSKKYSDGDGSYQKKYFTAAMIELDWASGKTTRNVQKNIEKCIKQKKNAENIETPKSCFLGLIEIDEVINVQNLC